MTNEEKEKKQNKLVTFFIKKKDKIKEDLSTPQKRKNARNRVIAILVGLVKYIFMFGISFVILYPLFLQIAVSLRFPTDVNDPTVLWVPKTFSLQNYKIALIALKYGPSLRNTFFNALFVAIFQVLSTSFAGYAFARLKFKGSGFLFGLAIFTIIVPQTMVSLPMYIEFAQKQLLGKRVVLYLMAALGMGTKSGIFIYLFCQFFKGIPVELEEAAYMDGASPFGVFFRIMLPNVKNGILTVALLAFVWQWNDYYFTNLFFVSSSTTVTTLATQLQTMGAGGVIHNAVLQANIWQLIGQDVERNPLFVSMIMNTAGILVMLPVLIIYFFLQKFFVQGIERSGIVG
jgi:multiple sugar transport system permease protein